MLIKQGDIKVLLELVSVSKVDPTEKWKISLKYFRTYHILSAPPSPPKMPIGNSVNCFPTRLAHQLVRIKHLACGTF